MATTNSVRLIIYACPVGILENELNIFFESSEAKFGLNKVHEYIPHVTLTSFFDLRSRRDIPILIEELHSISSQSNPPSELMNNVRLRGSLGNTIKIAMNCDYLESCLTKFKKKVKNIVSINVKSSNSYHLSLAYGYSDNHFEELMNLVYENLSSFQNSNLISEDSKKLWQASKWEIRLYEPPTEEVKNQVVAYSSTKIWSQICEKWIEHFRLPLGGIIPSFVSCILPSELYVGCAPSGEKLEHLKRIGINAILDLTEDTDNYNPVKGIDKSFAYVNYSLVDVYKFSPLVGKGYPLSQNQLYDIYKILSQWYQDRKAIYIHCRAGANRSPLICMLYLVAIKRMKINTAIAEVSIKHQDAKPNAYQLQALCEYVKIDAR
ncbi:dual specificity protein phosphatase family protein [Pseudanabaena sp. FACHB-1998]|uniref:dual specificity protein phosphatase family protein n=1 Tax=Pseudanabaena sp. FACHB-1998 TaxID=2692858 RepID=UPI001681525C|nr:dual specificity protein phosphatase [Pseudanabaena sp. FACHB-1998]MBD2175523.1 dual specificity protein phosphatase family protein [Pseudanabaena sp. FACHB-1998]